MPKQTFILNGKPVTVNVHDDVRVLWVLRDLLGVTGPKYGCGINVCKACTSHINGRAFNPCSVRVGDLKKSDRVTTIEGLPRESKGPGLHPMQQAWLDHDVAQCGYCQPGPDHGRRGAGQQGASGRSGRSRRRTSTRSATSAAAARTPGSARRSSRVPGR